LVFTKLSCGQAAEITDPLENIKKDNGYASIINGINNLIIDEKSYFKNITKEKLYKTTYNTTLNSQKFSLDGGIGQYIIPQSDSFVKTLENNTKYYNGHYNIPYKAGSFEMCATWSPSKHHIGNQFLKGIGSYGSDKKNDIVSSYEKICDESLDFDNTEIADIFNQFSKTGQGLEKQYLQNFKFPKKKQNKVQSFFNRLSLLFSMIEPVRRMNPGLLTISNSQFKMPEFPFAITYAMSCELMKHNELDFADIFDKDAKYGPFTDMAFSKCTKRTLPKKIFSILQKINNIHQDYISKILKEEDYNDLYIKKDDIFILTKKGCEELLNKYYHL
jgi:hypothetical protein